MRSADCGWIYLSGHLITKLEGSNCQAYLGLYFVIVRMIGNEFKKPSLRRNKFPQRCAFIKRSLKGTWLPDKVPV